MGRFTVSKPYTLPREDVRGAAELLAEELKQRYGMRYRWQGDTATFTRTGLDGTLSIENGSIDLDIRMGLLASAFEKPLREAITRYLDEYVT